MNILEHTDSFFYIFKYLSETELSNFSQCSKDCLYLKNGFFEKDENIISAVKENKIMSLKTLFTKEDDFSLDELNECTIYACKNRNVSVLKKLFDMGADNHEYLIWDVVMFGFIDILDVIRDDLIFMEQYDVFNFVDFNKYLYVISRAPSTKINDLIEWFEKEMEDDIDYLTGITGAIFHDSIEVCEIFLNKIVPKQLEIFKISNLRSSQMLTLITNYMFRYNNTTFQHFV